MPCLTLAIMTGRNRSRAKINSMKFFKNNIREVAEWQPDKIGEGASLSNDIFKRRAGH